MFTMLSMKYIQVLSCLRDLLVVDATKHYSEHENENETGFTEQPYAFCVCKLTPVDWLSVCADGFRNLGCWGFEQER